MQLCRLARYNALIAIMHVYCLLPKAKAQYLGQIGILSLNPIRHIKEIRYSSFFCDLRSRDVYPSQ